MKKRTKIIVVVVVAGALAFAFFVPVYYVPGGEPCLFYGGVSAQTAPCGPSHYRSLVLELTMHPAGLPLYGADYMPGGRPGAHAIYEILFGYDYWIVTPWWS